MSKVKVISHQFLNPKYCLNRHKNQKFSKVFNIYYLIVGDFLKFILILADSQKHQSFIYGLVCFGLLDFFLHVANYFALIKLGEIIGSPMIFLNVELWIYSVNTWTSLMWEESCRDSACLHWKMAFRVYESCCFLGQPFLCLMFKALVFSSLKWTLSIL